MRTAFPYNACAAPACSEYQPRYPGLCRCTYPEPSHPHGISDSSIHSCDRSASHEEARQAGPHIGGSYFRCAPPRFEQHFLSAFSSPIILYHTYIDFINSLCDINDCVHMVCAMNILLYTMLSNMHQIWIASSL